MEKYKPFLDLGLPNDRNLRDEIRSYGFHGLMIVILLGVKSFSLITQLSKRYFTGLYSLDSLFVAQFENAHPFSGSRVRNP